jgi:hypothetical protein
MLTGRAFDIARGPKWIEFVPAMDTVIPAEVSLASVVRKVKRPFDFYDVPSFSMLQQT